MTDLEDRIASLRGRTSRGAWLCLRQLRHHPKFAELLAQFERLGETLLETDIEPNVRRFLIENPYVN